MNSPRLFLLILCFVCLPMIVAEENEEGFSFFRRFKRQAKPKTHEFTFEDKVAITRQHNQFRRYPEATNMEKMVSVLQGYDSNLKPHIVNFRARPKPVSFPRSIYLEARYSSLQIVYNTVVK